MHEQFFFCLNLSATECRMHASEAVKLYDLVWNSLNLYHKVILRIEMLSSATIYMWVDNVQIVCNRTKSIDILCVHFNHQPPLDNNNNNKFVYIWSIETEASHRVC